MADVAVADRSFALGEYLSSPTGQMGVVAGLHIFVDLKGPDGTIHEHVSTEQLSRVKEFGTGDFVLRGPSLGKVCETFQDLTLRLQDGSSYSRTNVRPGRYLPIRDNNFAVDKEFPYHTGQRVQLCISKDTNQSVLATVSSVERSSVHVEWLASAGVGRDGSITLFKPQDPSDLTLLSPLIHTKLKVGDYCRTKDGSLGGTLLIVNSRTYVDVVWQGGTVDFGREATTLIPTETTPDFLFAERYVMENLIDDDGDNNTAGPERRVGVIKSLDSKERAAIVRWLKPLHRAEEPCQFESEETVSVYELVPHPDYDYYGHGDVVVRLSPSAGDSLEDAAKHGNDLQDKVNAHLSWFGTITGLKDGAFEVTWADGVVSKVSQTQLVYSLTILIGLVFSSYIDLHPVLNIVLL